MSLFPVLFGRFIFISLCILLTAFSSLASVSQIGATAGFGAPANGDTTPEALHQHRLKSVAFQLKNLHVGNIEFLYESDLYQTKILIEGSQVALLRFDYITGSIFIDYAIELSNKIHVYQSIDFENILYSQESEELRDKGAFMDHGVFHAPHSPYAIVTQGHQAILIDLYKIKIKKEEGIKIFELPEVITHKPSAIKIPNESHTAFKDALQLTTEDSIYTLELPAQISDFQEPTLLFKSPKKLLPKNATTYLETAYGHYIYAVESSGRAYWINLANSKVVKKTFEVTWDEDKLPSILKDKQNSYTTEFFSKERKAIAYVIETLEKPKPKLWQSLFMKLFPFFKPYQYKTFIFTLKKDGPIQAQPRFFGDSLNKTHILFYTNQFFYHFDLQIGNITNIIPFQNGVQHTNLARYNFTELTDGTVIAIYQEFNKTYGSVSKTWIINRIEVPSPDPESDQPHTFIYRKHLFHNHSILLDPETGALLGI